MKYSYYGATDIGCKRKKNDDEFIAQTVCGEQYLLVVVADGIGGNEGGELASHLTCKGLIDCFKGVQPEVFCLDFLSLAVMEANNRIISAQRNMPRFSNMGCVLVAVLFDYNKHVAHICHVGDARLYGYKEQTLAKITEDDSLTCTDEELKLLPDDSPLRSWRRNIVTRFIGERTLRWNDDYIHTKSIPIESYTQYLLCSDGLYDMLPSETIESVLALETKPQQKVELLIQRTNDKGGNDNVTAILIEMNK